MIEFNRKYRFGNELGDFGLVVKTVEHPTPYGNGMLLSILPVETPADVCIYDLCSQYDIRYEKVGSVDDLHDLVMTVLWQDYGVAEAEYEEV